LCLKIPFGICRFFPEQDRLYPEIPAGSAAIIQSLYVAIRTRGCQQFDWSAALVRLASMVDLLFIVF